MSKALTNPLFPFIARLRPHRPYNNGNLYSALFIQPQSSDLYKTTPVSSNPRWIFTTTSFPPPEWVQPVTDLSDLITNPKNLQISPWVPQILNLLDNSPNMEHNLDTFCHKVLIKLSPSFVAFLLKQNQLRNNLDIAFRVFQWVGKQKGYAHNLECYVSLIEILSVSGDLDRIRCVLRELRNKCFLMNVFAANSLIRSFGNLGMVEELLWGWREMKENGIEPSLYTYDFLMNGLVNSMFIELAELVFEVMAGRKIGPDVVAYNTMIKGYCKAGKTQKAREKFREMEARNVEPDKITYMTLMQACYSEGDFDSCLGFYHEMEEKELEIPPHAYSLVIGGLSKEGKSLEGRAVFESMFGKGCKANVAIYTTLMDSYKLSTTDINLDQEYAQIQR